VKLVTGDVSIFGCTMLGQVPHRDHLDDIDQSQRS